MEFLNFVVVEFSNNFRRREEMIPINLKKKDQNSKLKLQVKKFNNNSWLADMSILSKTYQTQIWQFIWKLPTENRANVLIFSHSTFLFESISKISFENFVTDRFGTECLMWFSEFFYMLI